MGSSAIPPLCTTEQTVGSTGITIFDDRGRGYSESRPGTRWEGFIQFLLLIALAIALSVCARVEAEAAPRTFSDAQSLFFNARYDAAAELALDLRRSEPDDLAIWELRSSGLLFQLKALLGDQPDKSKAFKQCVACPGLLTAFVNDTEQGVALARACVQAAPDDVTARYFLGKINLNYVWLQLGALGRRTGWDEYWEARRSMDAVLARNPAHIRARVARAWIDYIVDTRMPFATKWLLGGGNRKRALLTIQDAANADADFFVHAEARFALWELQVRERNVPAAVAVARGLAVDFPDNPELARYLGANDFATAAPQTSEGNWPPAAAGSTVER